MGEYDVCKCCCCHSSSNKLDECTRSRFARCTKAFFCFHLLDRTTHCRTVNSFILNGTKWKWTVNVILSHTVCLCHFWRNHYYRKCVIKDASCQSTYCMLNMVHSFTVFCTHLTFMVRLFNCLYSLLFSFLSRYHCVFISFSCSLSTSSSGALMKSNIL